LVNASYGVVLWAKPAKRHERKNPLYSKAFEGPGTNKIEKNNRRSPDEGASLA
jgi:hypothetical protein